MASVYRGFSAGGAVVCRDRLSEWTAARMIGGGDRVGVLNGGNDAHPASAGGALAVILAVIPAVILAVILGE